MKLRFDKSSLRLRVKKSDLEKLQKNNSIHETIEFPGTSLTYQLSISTDVNEARANFYGQLIEVVIPEAAANSWIDQDEVGIYHTMKLENDHYLDIVIEKDFPCKESPRENISDTFSELAEKNQPQC